MRVMVFKLFDTMHQQPMSLEERGETFDLNSERLRKTKEKGIKRGRQNSRSKILKTFL
jgi:RNA polymerase primary sigma factor